MSLRRKANKKKQPPQISRRLNGVNIEKGNFPKMLKGALDTYMRRIRDARLRHRNRQISRDAAKAIRYPLPPYVEELNKSRLDKSRARRNAVEALGMLGYMDPDKKVENPDEQSAEITSSIQRLFEDFYYNLDTPLAFEKQNSPNMGKFQ